MLRSLSIRDIVLIDRLDIEWSSALCTLTGETGAGKSILLDALGLATGARGDAGLVRRNAGQGSVTAIFEIDETHALHGLLQARGIVGKDQRLSELILRRVQTDDGRTRAYCNDALISVALLKEIGAHLIEIHGQNESQSLTDPSSQRALLDTYAGLTQEVADLRALYAHARALDERVQALETALSHAAEEADFLRHSVEELQILTPQAGEEEKLAAERTMLMSAEKIASDLGAVAALLQGDAGIEATLNTALKQLERVVPEAGGRLDGGLQALERALVEAAEARREIAGAMGEIVFDAARLEQVEERLFGLRDVARKHRVTVEQLPDLLEDMRSRLTEVDGGSGQLDALRDQARVARAAFDTAAAAISKARHAAARELDRAVNAELPALKLDGGSFETCISAGDEATASGYERVTFAACTNPGMAAGPIAKIASGGELARFMLALKVALATKAEHSDSGQTLIFDEVDAGVGGAVAEAVGQRLRQLATKGQVLVVTHSPQVAASGDHQWQVCKRQAGETVLTDVASLGERERLEEIARMLSGAEITDEARGAAARLLQH